MTQALIEIQRVLSEANAAGKLTDTIWRGPAETLFDYIQNEIDAAGTTGCTDQDQIAEPQKFTVDSEMSRAFEIEYGQDWKDPDWRRETGVWASAWHKATNAARASAPQAVQPAVPFMHGIADGCGNAYFEEGCVAPEARDLQPEVDGLNSCLDDDERPYSVVPLYTQPAAQGLDAREFPPMTPELASILGLMCFQCISFAQALRAAGHTIKTSAEDEQAAVLHWMLGHYFRHGDDWRTVAAEDMKRIEAEALAAQAKQGGA